MKIKTLKRNKFINSLNKRINQMVLHKYIMVNYEMGRLKMNYNGRMGFAPKEELDSYIKNRAKEALRARHFRNHFAIVRKYIRHVNSGKSSRSFFRII